MRLYRDETGRYIKEDIIARDLASETIPKRSDLFWTTIHKFPSVIIFPEEIMKEDIIYNRGGNADIVTCGCCYHHTDGSLIETSNISIIDSSDAYYCIKGDDKDFMVYFSTQTRFFSRDDAIAYDKFYNDMIAELNEIFTQETNKEILEAIKWKSA